jgi:hypothetical protein
MRARQSAPDEPAAVDGLAGVVFPSDFGFESGCVVLSAPEFESEFESDDELPPAAETESELESELDPPSDEPSDDEAGDADRRFAVRSFLAQPVPLKWIVGAVKALRTGAAPQIGQTVGPSAVTEWMTSKR